MRSYLHASPSILPNFDWLLALMQLGQLTMRATWSVMYTLRSVAIICTCILSNIVNIFHLNLHQIAGNSSLGSSSNSGNVYMRKVGDPQTHVRSVGQLPFTHQEIEELRTRTLTIESCHSELKERLHRLEVTMWQVRLVANF
jgi:hypothetical protein